MVLFRSGGDLLSHALRRSTISAEGFHGRVRNGIGWITLAITTKSSKRAIRELVLQVFQNIRSILRDRYGLQII